jgi:hypothetical protein
MASDLRKRVETKRREEDDEVNVWAEVSRGLAFSTRFHLCYLRLLSSYGYTVSQKYLEISLLSRSRSHDFHSSRLYVNVGFFRHHVISRMFARAPTACKDMQSSRIPI